MNKKTNKEKWDPFVRGFVLYLWILIFGIILAIIMGAFVLIINLKMGLIVGGIVDIVIIIALIIGLMNRHEDKATKGFEEYVGKIINDLVLEPKAKNKVGEWEVPTSKDINPPTKDDVKFTFKWATPVNAEGFSKVTYEVDVNPILIKKTPWEKEFHVGGFLDLQTKKQQNK